MILFANHSSQKPFNLGLELVLARATTGGGKTRKPEWNKKYGVFTAVCAAGSVLQYFYFYVVYQELSFGIFDPLTFISVDANRKSPKIFRFFFFAVTQDNDGLTTTGARRVSHHVWIHRQPTGWTFTTCLSKSMKKFAVEGSFSKKNIWYLCFSCFLEISFGQNLIRMAVQHRGSDQKRRFTSHLMSCLCRWCFGATAQEPLRLQS